MDASRDVHLFTGVDARQMTRFAAPARGAAPVAFATANPGRVVAVGAGVQSPATYISSVRDTKSVATWGQVRWDATGSGRPRIALGQHRTPGRFVERVVGPVYHAREGEVVTSPPARFIQWRAVLTRATAGAGADADLRHARLPAAQQSAAGHVA